MTAGVNLITVSVYERNALKADDRTDPLRPEKNECRTAAGRRKSPGKGLKTEQKGRIHP